MDCNQLASTGPLVGCVAPSLCVLCISRVCVCVPLVVGVQLQLLLAVCVLRRVCMHFMQHSRPRHIVFAIMGMWLCVLAAGV